MSKCAILIDGNNFYFKIKDLGWHNFLEFNFNGFLKLLSGSDEIKMAQFYIGAVRTDGTKKTQQLFNQQRRLLVHLRKNGLEYSLGYLLKSNGRFHEKGVDVNMAVDIMSMAYENLVDRIIIVSSDTDLLPAVQKAKEKKKHVEYIGFSHMPSLALKANCSSTKLLSKDDLLPFIIKSSNKTRGKK